jgi:hypothetical protein
MTMKLLDQAKDFVEEHKPQIQQGLDKAKATMNKATETIKEKTSGRHPNSGTDTPVGQTAPATEQAAADPVPEPEAEASDSPSDTAEPAPPPPAEPPAG